MSDLSYKLPQIARSLRDLGYTAWSDAVATAGAEIERLKHEAGTPGPATAAYLDALKRYDACSISLSWDQWTALRAAFIAEHEPAAKEVTP